ncbi:MAG: hypothetical protein AB7Q97_19845 [Gammaproteobacteria bacterium]
MDERTDLRSLIDPGAAGDCFAVDGLPPFDPADCAHWSRANALWLSECCRLIYRQDAASRRACLAGVGLQERAFFDDGATQGALVAGPGFAILVFRGTLGLRDWLYNLDAAAVRWEGPGRIHRGFAAQLRRCWERIRAELRPLQVPLFVTGHSLGGALATLATAYCLISDLPRPAAVYTFGAPRAGTRGLRDLLAAGPPLWRVENGQDVVPSVPAQGPIAGLPSWRHAGTGVHLHAGGRLEFESKGSSAPPVGVSGWLSDAFAAFAAPHLPAFLTDHAPVNYTARLERSAPAAAPVPLPAGSSPDQVR